jgi:hypothetical protein
VKDLWVDYCGERFDVVAGGEGLTIGREADLSIDDNPYLHRVFLTITEEFGLWWLSNTGSLLSATVSDASGHVQAWLAPGAKLPIVFEAISVIFSAGSTTYDFSIHSDEDYYNTTVAATHSAGVTTMMPVNLTSSQRLLIVALCEQVLLNGQPGRGVIPSSAEAAERLGWSMTTFNRKLDNVCDKLDKLGVRGLRGGKGNLATHRRARLVEYAIASRLVSRDDLVLLDLSRDDAAPE